MYVFYLVTYSPQELSVYRNVIGVVPAIFYIWYSGELSLSEKRTDISSNFSSYKIERWKLAVARGFVVAVAQLCFYTAPIVKIRTGNCVSFRSGERAFHSSPSHFNLQRKSRFLALVCSYYWFSWRRHDHKAWFGHFFMVFTFTGLYERFKSFLLCDINYNFTKFQKFCFECNFIFIFSNICSSW